MGAERAAVDADASPGSWPSWKSKRVCAGGRRRGSSCDTTRPSLRSCAAPARPLSGSGRRRSARSRVRAGEAAALPAAREAAVAGIARSVQRVSARAPARAFEDQRLRSGGACGGGGCRRRARRRRPGRRARPCAWEREHDGSCAFNSEPSRSERRRASARRDVGRRPSRRLAGSSIRSSSARAPALDSGSLRLPHFGDCTHEGQPLAHGHSAISAVRVAAQLLEALKAVRVMPMPPGWPS